MAWNRDKERKAGKAMSIGASVYAVIFLVVWNLIAMSMGAWIMLLFGIPFLGLMIYRLVMCIRLSKEDKPKSADPWERPARQDTEYRESPYQNPPRSESGFCPYCGHAVDSDFAFCPQCGRKLS